MSTWSWLKLRVCLWLLRKAVTVTRWLLLGAVVIAAWPVTLIAVIEYAAAWLRGWPAARLYRTAAWALPVTAVWLIIVEVRMPGWRSAASIPGRAWGHGFHYLGGAGLVHTLALLVPVTVPAGLALAGLAWAWRTYAVTAGVGGWTASAPIIFDARQWKRQVRTATGLNKAPGAVPLWPGRADPGRRDDPPHRARLAARVLAAGGGVRPAHGGGRRDRVGQDQPDDPAVGGLVHRRPPGGPGRRGNRPC